MQEVKKGRQPGSKNLTQVDRLITAAIAYAGVMGDPRTLSALLSEASLEKLERAEHELSQAQSAAQRLLEAFAPRLATLIAEFEREKLVADQQAVIDNQAAEIERLQKLLRTAGQGDKVEKASKGPKTLPLTAER